MRFSPQPRRNLRHASALALTACLAASAAAGLGHAQSPKPPGEAATQSPPPAPPGQEDTQAFIIDFLEKGYLQAWFAHPSSVRQHFADPVANYWGRSNVPLNAVVQEKLSYARKWIFRFYRLQPETIRLVPAPGKPDLWQVTFNYDFVADSAPPRSSGVGETTLVLEIIGDQVKIHGESGKVISRKRIGAPAGG
jgi:hypothetical protein